MLTKPVRITVHEVHDGLGGVHKLGDVVEFEGALADFFVSRGQAEIVDREALKEAATKASDLERQRRQAAIKNDAMRSMRVFDALPPEVRAAAAEHGDAVIDQFLQPNEPLGEILRSTAAAPPQTNDDAFEFPDIDPPKRKRGRPRKDAS